MTETQMLLASIISNHNVKIVENALNTLKQFAENGDSLYLYDENGNSFKFTLDTKYVLLQFLVKED